MRALLSLCRTLIFFVTFAVGMALGVSAYAAPRAIPDDITPAEIIQRAQEASDRNRYGLALQYYQALLYRHSTIIDLVCTAEYEIAFIHYKQKKYVQARGELNALLLRYNTPDAELLPQQFKRLAVIVLERINEKENPKPLFKKNTRPITAPDKTLDL